MFEFHKKWTVTRFPSSTLVGLDTPSTVILYVIFGLISVVALSVFRELQTRLEWFQVKMNLRKALCGGIYGLRNRNIFRRNCVVAREFQVFELVNTLWINFNFNSENLHQLRYHCQTPEGSCKSNLMYTKSYYHLFCQSTYHFH